MSPTIILAALILWLASLAGVGVWQHGDGVAVTEARYIARDRDALAANAESVFLAEEKARITERQHAAQLAAISTDYQEQIKNEKIKTAALVAAVRSGAYRLRDPGRIALVPTYNLSTESPAPAAGRDGAGDGELSKESAGFLLGLAGRCNLVRDQLGACQAVVVADRKP